MLPPDCAATPHQCIGDSPTDSWSAHAVREEEEEEAGEDEEEARSAHQGPSTSHPRGLSGQSSNRRGAISRRKGRNDPTNGYPGEVTPVRGQT